MTSNQTEADDEATDPDLDGSDAPGAATTADNEADEGPDAPPEGHETDGSDGPGDAGEPADAGGLAHDDTPDATDAADDEDAPHELPPLAEPFDVHADVGGKDAATDTGDAEGDGDGDLDHGEGDYDDDLDDEGPSRVMLVVGAVVAFVAIAIVGVLIATSGDGGGGGGGGGGNDSTAADARTDVGIFGTTDQFDRADSDTTLGDFAPGRPWSPETGTWGIDADEAYLVRGGEFRNHAVIGLGQGDGGAQVRLDKVVTNSGLVFRYVGPYNYWAVVAVPDVATWNVIKVVDGDQEVVGNTGQSPTADGTTVGVRLRGDTIEVIINGRIRKTIVDDFQVDAGKVGITARGPDSTDARFDDFVAGLPGGVPITGGGGGGGGGGNGSGSGAGGSSTTTSAP